MQVLDIIKNAVAKVGLAQVDSVPNHLYELSLGFLNSAYKDVWNLYPLRDEKLVGVTVSLTSGTEEVTLPQEVDVIRAVRTTDDPISPVGEMFLYNVVPSAFTDEGSPAHFYNLADSPLESQPSAATTLTFSSDSSNDKNITVRVFGEVSSEDAYEDVSLFGTSSMTSTKSFTTVYSISKALTAGRITVKDSGATTLGTIPPWMNQSLYRRVRVYPIPDDSYTLYVLGLRRWPQLTSRNDTILLSKAEGAIRSMLTAELYEYLGNDARAQAERAKAGEQMKIAIAREEVQDEEDTRSYPAWGMFGDGSWPLDTSETGTGRLVYN